MRWIALLLGVPASLALMAASMGCNWLFFSGLANTFPELCAIGVLSVSNDIFKALCPFWFAEAVKARKPLPAFGAVVFMLVCLGVAVSSAMGFMAGTRGQATGGREAVNLRYKGAEQEQAEVEAKLRGLRGQDARSAAAVEQAINAVRQDRRWQSTDGCQNATAKASLEYCQGFFALKGKLQDAIDAERLEKRLEELRKEGRTLKSQGAGQEADPQASFVSQVLLWIGLGLSVASVQLGLNLLPVLLLEFGATFGLYFSLAVGQGRWIAGKDSQKASREERTEPAKSARVLDRPRKVRLGSTGG